uniref:Uncharacterized protein n=1 Tax=Arundo donax TaxID=35708 RepID=A0A0A9CD53_ARUDO
MENYKKKILQVIKNFNFCK